MATESPCGNDRTPLLATQGVLICPVTRRPLHLTSLDDAERAVGGSLRPAGRTGSGPDPVGPQAMVLLRDDHTCAYPVVDGVPILLAPEMLVPEGGKKSFDLNAPQYREAYEEMALYNGIAAGEVEHIQDSGPGKAFRLALEAVRSGRGVFPHPSDAWVDSVYDSLSQWDSYNFVAPVEGRIALQLGGKGSHAVKFLLAGATEGWLLTPMLGEIKCALALAKWAGVDDRLRCCVGVAEEMPFAADTFDVVYSASCIHHMVINLVTV